MAATTAGTTADSNINKAILENVNWYLVQWLSTMKTITPQRHVIISKGLSLLFPSLSNAQIEFLTGRDNFEKVYDIIYSDKPTDNDENSKIDEMIGNLISLQYNFENLSDLDRSIGVLLGVACGDILGAPLEGLPHDFICSKYRNATKGILNFIPGDHMGKRGIIRYGRYTDDTMTTLGLALGLTQTLCDNNDKNDKNDKKDDNNEIKCNEIDGSSNNNKFNLDCAKISLKIAQFWKYNIVSRGLPDTAQNTLQSLIDNNGENYDKSGFSQFKDGSYANGGAMRISPMGILLRNFLLSNNDKNNNENNLQKKKLYRKYISDAIIATHCNEEAIDGAVIIARAIGYCFHCRVNSDDSNNNNNNNEKKEENNDNGNNEFDEFDGKKMFQLCMDDELIKTDIMKQNLNSVFNCLENGGYFFKDNAKKDKNKNKNENENKNNSDLLLFINDSDIDYLGNIHQFDKNDKIRYKVVDLLNFQIRTSEAVPLVLYCVARWYNNPMQCIANCVSLGGDNDTTASMVGAIMGALYGTYWIPKRWYNNIENEYGIDIQTQFENEQAKSSAKSNLVQKLFGNGKNGKNDKNDKNDKKNDKSLDIEDNAQKVPFGKDLMVDLGRKLARIAIV